MKWIAGLQRGMHSQEFQCRECKHWICHEVNDDLPLSCEKCGARKEIMNSSTCPLCGVDTPHNHSPAEQVIYKNGVKAGSIASPQQAIPAYFELLLIQLKNACTRMQEASVYPEFVKESRKLILNIESAAQQVIPALLYEANDFGQFADDFDQPLAKPIRKAIRDLLSASPTAPIESEGKSDGTN
jgi:hypothetical protein